MKAIVRNKPGKEFSGLAVVNLSIPEPLAHEVLIKVAGSRVNPVDMDLMKGMPGLSFPRNQIAGVDGVGTIEKIGNGVKRFQQGDKVAFYRLFTHLGAWAEYVTVPEEWLAKLPSDIDLISAAALTLPLLTAHESLAAIQLMPNERLLVHGAGGGVGFCAVQLALQKGVEVYATASGKDVQMLKELGVKHVIDYKSQSFDQLIEKKKLDAVFDVLGGDTLMRSIALQPKRLISLHYMELSQMPKSGMKINLVLKWLIPLLMRKYAKLAKKNDVHLMGQVTGANGKHLQEAFDLYFEMHGKMRSPELLTLSQIEQTSLTKSSIGKIIVP